jgi:hypothetical protein
LQSFLYTWNTLLPPEPLINDDTSRREPMPNPTLSSQTSEATVRAALENCVAQLGEPQTETNVWPSRPRLGGSVPEARGVSGLSSGLANSPEAAGAPSYPLLVGREGSSQEENSSIHAGPNNLTTTGEVSVGASKPAPATESSTERSNLPKTVPNPQPIPFPSRAELEKQGYRFGPFSREHTPLDIEMIAHYAKRGYRPLQPHEVDYAEFRCNGVPFALAASVPYRPKPPEPLPPQKSPEEVAREELTAWLRKEQQSLPKCAERENFRLAPTKRR